MKHQIILFIWILNLLQLQTTLQLDKVSPFFIDWIIATYKTRFVKFEIEIKSKTCIAFLYQNML